MNPKRVSWATPIALALLCAAPFLSKSRASEEVLLQRLRSGECEALPLLAAGYPHALTPALMEELARHEEHRLRELVAHQAWIPHVKLRDQLTRIATLEPRELRERAKVWAERRTTSRETLTRADIAAYWTSREPR
ncbi:MAG: hypothetical protein MK297_02250 [Planctomycetes bacterium]|nr:hypothetical protein [Planctomycetota bacterium]